MIELRWASRVGRNPKAGPQTVLEYRTLRLRIDAGGALTPLPPPVEWTEWTRVPKVIIPRE